MKNKWHIALLALGIAMGIGGISLLKYALTPSAPVANSTVDEVSPALVAPRLAEASTAQIGGAQVSRHSRNHGRRNRRAHRVNPVQVAPIVAEAAPAPAPAPVVAAPVPTYFRADGYVEKADGQLEAILIQNDSVQILKLGDHIGEHLRVTSISPDSVGAIDEVSYHVPLNQTDGAGQSRHSGVFGVMAAYSHAPSGTSGPSVTLALHHF